MARRLYAKKLTTVSYIISGLVLVSLVATWLFLAPRLQTDVKQREFWFGYVAECEKAWNKGEPAGTLATTALSRAKQNWPDNRPEKWGVETKATPHGAELEIELDFQYPSFKRHTKTITRH